MFKSKIHRAVVTRSDLNYDGSIAIDSGLMRLADILPYEEVHVWNVTNGERFSTYAIPGLEHEICVNGAAARLVATGDRVIIATFETMTRNEAKEHQPIVVLVDDDNNQLIE